jgi:hypothetical protein
MAVLATAMPEGSPSAVRIPEFLFPGDSEVTEAPGDLASDPLSFPRLGPMAWDEGLLPKPDLTWADRGKSEVLGSVGSLPRDIEDETPQGEPPARREGVPDVNVGLHGRYTIPFGTANSNTIVYGNGLVVVSNHLSWADIFEPGWGVDLEMNIFFGAKGGFRGGLCVILQTDEYSAGHASGPLGSIDFGHLTMTSLMVGGAGMQMLGDNFYTRGHITIGPVHYSQVDGTITAPPFAPFKDELFEDTWTIASDFRFYAGYKLGPVGFVAGLGMRIQGPPNTGPHLSLSSGAFWTFDMNAGIEINF